MPGADDTHTFNDLYVADADISSGKLTPPFVESKKVLVADGKLEDWTGPTTKIFSPILKKSQTNARARASSSACTAVSLRRRRAVAYLLTKLCFARSSVVLRW